MNFLARFFAGAKAKRNNLTEENLSMSHIAVTQLQEGKISDEEALAILAAGFIIVPLGKEPERDGTNIKKWSPATVSKADGSGWVLAFTNKEAHMAFVERENYPFALTTSTDWVLGAMPPEHGLMLNMGTAYHLEWSAEGIRRFGSGLIGHPMENNVEFEPSNTLELFLKRWQAGEISKDEFFSVLVKSDLYVPSTTAISGDLSGLMPLFFWREGHSFASAFTSSNLMNLHKDRVKDSITMKGEEMLSRVAPRFHGVVINPGYRIGMEFTRGSEK
ncbi:MAG TPA: SseB family protein [Pyrinomonadaceae bacterium]